MAVIIPNGKLVKISTLANIKGGDLLTVRNSGKLLASLANTPLVLEEDITLNLNSSYAPVTSYSASTFLKIFSQSTRELTGYQVGTDFKELGFQLWENTKPVSLSITVGLYMKSDAQSEVWDPAKELMKIALPEELSGGAGFGLKAPGPSVLQALGLVKDTKDMLLVEIGKIAIFPAVITGVEPTINKEVDQFGNPISVKLRIDIQTTYTATTNLIDTWI